MLQEEQERRVALPLSSGRRGKKDRRIRNSCADDDDDDESLSTSTPPTTLFLPLPWLLLLLPSSLCTDSLSPCSLSLSFIADVCCWRAKNSSSLSTADSLTQ